MIRKLWPGLLASTISSAFAVGMFARLPERVVSHWGAGGVADGWMSRIAFVMFFPALLFGTAAVLAFGPGWDWRHKNFKFHEGSYWLVVNVLLVFLATTHILVTGINLGWNVKISWLGYGLGALFIVLGNVMTRIRRNRIFGVRTPWTLSSDRSWRETHRLAGYGTVLFGIALTLTLSVWPKSMVIVLVGGLLTLSAVSTVYSYYIWRKDTSGTSTT